MSENKVDEQLNDEQNNNESDIDNVEHIVDEAKTDSVEEKAEKIESEYKEKFYYLAAEMENLKRRQAKELENTRKYSSEKILKGLIDVVDNFDRTVDALSVENDEKVTNIVTGIEMVRKQFMDELNKNGLTLVDTVGKQFDPNVHEALAQEVSEDKEENEVLKEYQKGYVLNGRLLRAAKVVVAKK
jgi:molecular chaperone GrpE